MNVQHTFKNISFLLLGGTVYTYMMCFIGYVVTASRLPYYFCQFNFCWPKVQEIKEDIEKNNNQVKLDGWQGGEHQSSSRQWPLEPSVWAPRPAVSLPGVCARPCACVSNKIRALVSRGTFENVQSSFIPKLENKSPSVVE